MKKLQTGFTLIELMIVVAIIGILAAIAIPAYNGYIDTAKKDKVHGHFEQAFKEISNEIKKDTTAVALGQANGQFFRTSRSVVSSSTTTNAGIVDYLNGVHDGETSTVNYAPDTVGGALQAAYVVPGAGCALSANSTTAGQIGILWDANRDNTSTGVFVCQPAYGPTGDTLQAKTKSVSWE